MRSLAIKIVEEGWLPNQEMIDGSAAQLADEVGRYIKELGSDYNGHFESNAIKFVARLPLHLQGFCWDIAGSKDPEPAVKPEDIEFVTPREEFKRKRGRRRKAEVDDES